MREEAADAGRYQSKLWHDKDFPRIQILTIEGILSGEERVEAPPQVNPFAKAQREGEAQHPGAGASRGRKLVSLRPQARFPVK